MSSRLLLRILSLIFIISVGLGFSLAVPQPTFADSPPPDQAQAPELLIRRSLVAHSAFSCAQPVRIMPLGDSITAGKSSGVVDSTKWISYRKDLWDSLIAAGYNVDFVGSQTNGQFYSGFDPHHEGHGGWTDGQIADNIYDQGEKWLINHPADIILLHIGTNSLNSSPNDVKDILNEIDDFEVANNTEVIVILARIINRISYSQTTTDFNDNVEAMAQTRIANGDNIILVDMENGAGLSYNYQMGGDMWDNLHPYATGYTKMANVWFSELQNLLPTCDLTEPAIISSAVTTAKTHQVYSYDVNAVGNPTPTYSLSSFPPGMTINSTTGVINWTPTSAGTVNVTVQAGNSAGNDSQPFSVNVTDPPSCDISGGISYWKLDETSGTTFADFFGVNNATFSGSGSPGYTTGQLNGALDFNGSDQKLSTGSTTNPTGQISVMAWINPDNLNAPDRGIISKKNAFALEIEEAGDQLSFSIRNGSSTNEFEPDVPANVISAGAWTHVAATFDGTNTTLYINGVKIGTGVSNVSTIGSSSEPYVIGFNAAFDANRYFDGKIDEVAVFNRTLSATEIEQIYNNSINSKNYCASPEPNTDPVAEDDTATTNEDTPVTITVLNNDSDPDSDPLTITSVGNAANGTASISGAAVNYAPKLNFNGSDSFTYTISDGNGGQATATVAVTVNPVNDPPIITENDGIIDDSITVIMDEDSSPTAFSLTLIATDPDSDPLTWSITKPAGHGTASVNGTPDSSKPVNYTPTPNFNGADSFIVQVSDGSLTDTVTVNVTVRPQNDFVQANDDVKTVLKNSTDNVIDVLSNDLDPDGDPLSLTLISGPKHGTAVESGGKFVYTPTTDFVGADTFTYLAADNKGSVDGATVTVTVVDNAPAPDTKIYLPLIQKE